MYPEGFQGASLTDAERETVISVAAALNARKLARAKKFVNQHRQKTTIVEPYRETYKLVSLVGYHVERER